MTIKKEVLDALHEHDEEKFYEKLKKDEEEQQINDIKTLLVFVFIVGILLGIGLVRSGFVPI